MTVVATDAVVMTGVSKRFGSTQALDAVDFSVHTGEVHGLVGLNGSGKSTLMKVLSGYVAPAPGATCWLWGTEVTFPIRSPWQLGIASVPQTLGLNKSLTVLDNVNVAGALGRGRSAAWNIRRQREARQLRDVFGDLGWSLDPMSEVRHLTPGEQAIVAITRAFASTRLEHDDGQASRRSCVVLDEPTAYLTTEDTDRLLRAIARLVSQGDSAILISHRMGDIFAACERVTVLREGRVISVEDLAGSSKERLATLMTGAAVAKPAAVDSTGPAEPRTAADGSSPLDGDEQPVKGGPQGQPPHAALEIRAVSSGRLRKLNLTVAPGEVVGCTGLVGSGIDELTYAVVGHLPREGEVYLDNRRLAHTPAAVVRDGLSIVPADRGGQALWLEGSLVDNAVSIGRAARWGGLFVSRKRARAAVSEILSEYDVVARGPDDRMSELSGGNQQKLVIARALSSPGLKALVLHEPTSGVDVTARAAIHAMIRSRAAAGLAVIVCSSDIEEIVQVSDRVVVLVDGRKAHEFSRGEASADAVALACS